ncbi:unnamed protein product, partial [Darwinula stevensoni]
MSRILMDRFGLGQERGRSRRQRIPKSPSKSSFADSRLFPRDVSHYYKAHPVSFNEEDSSGALRSKLYNSSSRELYFKQCFEEVKKLGEGSFGEVFKVKSREDGKYYAVKRSRQTFRNESDRRRKLEEVQRYERLPSHPNCVRFYCAWEERWRLYIQTELCMMSLDEFCLSTSEIPEYLIWNYLVDLLMAVKHLHEHQMVHLDIKPENIFLTKDGFAKLGDFGLVWDMRKGDDASDGDAKYLAPEVITGEVTPAADIFSIGITILEMASDLDLPGEGPAWHLLRKGYLPDHLLTHISEELKNIMRRMMNPKPWDRPLARELLNEAPFTKLVRKRKLLFRWISLKCCLHSILLWFWYCFFVILGPLIRKRSGDLPHPQSSNYSENQDNSFSDEENDMSVQTHKSSESFSSSSSNGVTFNLDPNISSGGWKPQHPLPLNSTPLRANMTEGRVAPNGLLTPTTIASAQKGFIYESTPTSIRNKSRFRLRLETPLRDGSPELRSDSSENASSSGMRKHIEEEGGGVEVDVEYISGGCNPSPNCSDWGKNDIIIYGSSHSISLAFSQNNVYVVKETLQGHKGRVNCVKWIRRKHGAAESEFVSGGADSLVFLWSMDGKDVGSMRSYALQGHSSSVTQVDAMEWDDGRKTVVSASVDSTVCIWEAPKSGSEMELECKGKLSLGLSMGIHLASLPNPLKSQPVLFFATDDSRVHLYSPSQNDFPRLHSLIGHQDWVRALDSVIITGE